MRHNKMTIFFVLKLAGIIIILNSCNPWTKYNLTYERVTHPTTSDIPEFIKALEDENIKVRGNAAQALGKIGPEASKSVTALIKALEGLKPECYINKYSSGCNKDSLTSNQISNALGKIGKSAVPDLIEALDHNDNNVRQYAAIALGNIGPDAKDSISMLIKTIEKERGVATNALVKIGKPAVIPLVKALDSNSWQIREGALVALSLIGPIDKDLSNQLHGEYYRTLPISEANIAVPKLIKALEDKNKNIQRDAAATLANIGPGAKAAVPALIKALGYNDKIVSKHALIALGRIGPDAKSAIPALIYAIEDNEPNIRRYAAYALRNINVGAEFAVPSLIKLIKNENTDIRRLAFQLLIHFLEFSQNPETIYLDILKNSKDQNLRKGSITELRKLEYFGNDYRLLLKDIEQTESDVTVKKLVQNEFRNINFKLLSQGKKIELKKSSTNNFEKPITSSKSKVSNSVNISNVQSSTEMNNNIPNKLLSIENRIKISESDKLPAVNGKYHALIIGINDYKYLSKLSTAINDSKSVAKVLKKYGFTITLLISNVTRTQILKQMNKLRQNLLPEDKLLIYYAGHGYFNKETEKAYWLPIDAEMNDTTNWIIADTITSSIKTISAKHILIVSDSCYSGTLTRRRVAIDLSSRNSRKYFLNKMFSKKARVLISSGGNEPVIDDNGSGHSVFADAFIKALKNNKHSFITAEELFISNIKEQVAGNANQIPEYQLIRNSGHSGGDFIFVKK